jgi:ribonucleoside-diphosphate reductase alpha chain
MKVTIKNPYLKKLLEERGKDDKEVWNSIRDNNGSVQHLEFLSKKEKDVFKTFAEIDQVTILEQASVRQKYVDQSQSLNVVINPKTPTKDINAFYIKAWKLGIKTLYYQHSQNAAQELNRKKMCTSCEI